jgi:hypothetical protein
MIETIYEKTLKEFLVRLVSGKLDKLDETRIANFIKRYPNKHWTREQIISDCLANEKFCARMAKDALKQNLDESEVIKKIGAEKLPAGGKFNVRFRMDNGEIVIGAKAEYGLTKSADFVMKYKNTKIYGSQKTIHGEGGHQTTQVREAIEFVRAGNKKYKAIAVVDGKNVPEIGVFSSDEIVKKTKKNENLI